MTPTSKPTPAALVDIATIAEQLGVTVRHVRRLVAERRIPYVKWGHLIRFEPHTIDDWIGMHSRAALRDADLAADDRVQLGHAERTPRRRSA